MSRSLRVTLGLSLLLVASAADASPPATELVVIAKLVLRAKAPPHCGVFHFGEVTRYQVQRTLRGATETRQLDVLHGCTELPRAVYRKNAGSLKRFRVGDIHRLVLIPYRVGKTDGPPPMFAELRGRGKSPLYWCRRADLAVSERQRRR